MAAEQDIHMTTQRPSRGRIFKIVVLAWLGMLGFDFLLHGGILASLYTRPSPFLLPPERAFLLIPLGYLSFFMLAVALVWLLRQTNCKNAIAGLRFGLQLGSLLWGSLILGLVSISTADLDLLIGWFIGQTLELGLAGYIAGQALQQVRLKGLFIKLVVFMALMLVLTIVMQSLGLAPAMRLPDN